MASSLFKVTVVQHWLYDCWIDGDGRPCEQNTPGARFVKSRKVPAGTPGARKVKKKSGKWYGRLPGSTKPVPLSSNKVAAQQLLAEMVKKAELGRAGILDPFEEQRKRPLDDHLSDYRRELEARDNTGRYVEMVLSRLKSVFDDCGMVQLGNLDDARVMECLADLRNNGPSRKPLAPDKEEFSLREVAELLGVKPASVAPLVARHGLPASGQGKARRFPRRTVEVLRSLRAGGASVETLNQYIRHLKGFGAWLVRSRRAAANPFLHLEAGNAQADRRHARRELTRDEMRRVLNAARESKQSFRGLSGEDRFHLYACACGTGFRAGALASLTPESFDLDGEVPTVTLAARDDKSRRGKVQPLPADVAGLLRTYLAGKPAGKPIWPGNWAKHRTGAGMLRIDLKAAGVLYVVEGPSGPEYADFHALRHSYLTLAGRAGIDLRTLQELAGHSTPALTARYSHRRLHDLAGAIEKLPGFLPEAERGALRATGTNSALAPVCTGFVQTGDTGRDFLRLAESAIGPGPEKQASLNPVYSQGVEASCDSLRQPESRAGDGIRTRDVQLGNAAVWFRNLFTGQGVTRRRRGTLRPGLRSL